MSAAESPPPGAIGRDPGDAWVESPDGRRYWGRFGAAGLLAHDPRRGVLLQHRVGWSHFGGTWGIPGGAIQQGETAVDGALREAAEESGAPRASLSLLRTSVLDLGVWSYTTVLAAVREPFEPVIADAESLELRWVPLDEIEAMPLHPGFGGSWPALRAMLAEPLTLLVDGANVVGSRPDGWWRDRAGAAERLAAALGGLAGDGLPAASLGVEGAHAWPAIELVLEGAARPAVEREVPGVAQHAAPADGDGALVELARERIAEGRRVVTVTADRALRERLVAAGAGVVGPSTLLDLLG
jgi:8-oxo-dGTP pyrophosphatase MutT (NUDIX family)